MPPPSSPPSRTAAVAKYDPLFEALCRAADGPLTMTIDDIDALVSLPSTAKSQRAWWKNDPTKPQAKAWLNAGREVVTVDPSGGTVQFSAATWRRGS